MRNYCSEFELADVTVVSKREQFEYLQKTLPASQIIIRLIEKAVTQTGSDNAPKPNISGLTFQFTTYVSSITSHFTARKYKKCIFAHRYYH